MSPLSKTILLLLFVSSLAIAKENKLTYKEFGHLPMIEYPMVSPNGDKVVAVFNSDKGPSVVVSDFGSNDITTLVQLQKSRDRIEDIYWVNENRLLVIASYSEKIVNRYFRSSRIFSINVDGTDLRELALKTPKKLAPWEKRAMNDIDLVSLLKRDDSHVLLQTFDVRDEGQVVYKVNVYTGKFEKLFSNTYNVHSWVVDENDNVVFGYGTEHSQSDVNTIWYRKTPNDDWKLIHKRKAFEGETFDPIIVENDKLYVLSDRETRRSSLWLYDIASAKFEKMVFGHEKYDLQGALYNSDRNKLVGVYYYEHFRKNHYIDAKSNQLSALVKNTFKTFHTNIYSNNKAKDKLLVAAAKDNSPSKFFWLDLTKKSAGVWFSQYPYLENQPLANVLPISFTTRDKVDLTGYLTLPVVNSNKKPPLIVWPHGGPIGVRDYMYFDPYVQFFSNKGYAVLQVNYRGSGGFGSDFEVAGHHEWGKKMQQDLYDGLDWLLSKDLVDKNNMCFAGYSYGGYAALTAAFQQPEKFDCIISIAGVSDLYKLAETDYKWKGNIRSHIINTIGDPTDEKVKEELKSLSAINNLDKIKAPILLLHGTHDTQVRVKQSAKFYDEAKKKGLDIKYVEYKWGTHYLDEQENRLDAFEEIEEFLEEYLEN